MSRLRAARKARARLVESLRHQQVRVLTTGDQLRLHCRTAGRPTPSVTWYKDGVALSDEHSRAAIHHHRSVLLVWYGIVNVDLYGAIITKVSNALKVLVYTGEKPGFQALSNGLVVLLCAEVVRQGLRNHAAVHSECSASDSG